MFRSFFAGRNGIDRYSVFLALVSLMTFPYPYVRVAGFALFFYALFRVFSKNLDKRRNEFSRFDDINRKAALSFVKGFRRIKNKLLESRKFFQQKKIRLQQRKQYLFIKCPQCKKTLRLPRNKGRLQATCPVCKTEFIKKT